MDNLEPITRNEMFLNGDDLEPITREEMILAGADLEPLTRHEWFLKKYRGGGDVTIERLAVTENGTYSESGKAYSPVVVNVPAPPIPENAYLLNDLSDLPADIASFTDGTDLPMASLKVAVTPYQDLSHGDPSPDNICPIIGWDEAVVTRCGKNLWSANGTISGTLREVINTNIPTGTYTFSALVTSSDTDKTTCRVQVTYNDDTYDVLQIERNVRSSVQVNSPEGKTITSFAIYASDTYNRSVGDTFTFADIMLEKGTTATTYAPYNGATYTIDLDGTRYGGTLDVTSGVLKVVGVMAVLDGSSDEAWDMAQGAFLINDIFNWDSTTSATNPVCMCNMYEEGNAISSSSQVPTRSDFSFFNQSNYKDRLWVKDSRYSTVEDFKTALASQPLQIIYPLATPITVQLSPTQVKSLVGVNNINANCGQITEVKYFKKA